MSAAAIKLARPLFLRRLASASASSLRLGATLPKSFDAFREAFPHQCSKQIEYRDLDAYGHVNNTVYFSFYEEIRIRTWRKTANEEMFGAKGIAPVLQDTWTHFRMPLQLFDTIHIGMQLEDAVPEKASMVHRYCVWSEKYGAVAAEGGATLVLCDFDNDGKRAKGLTNADMEKWM